MSCQKRAVPGSSGGNRKDEGKGESPERKSEPDQGRAKRNVEAAAPFDRGVSKADGSMKKTQTKKRRKPSAGSRIIASLRLGGGRERSGPRNHSRSARHAEK